MQSHTSTAGETGDKMSGDVPKAASSEAHHIRVQRKWATLLRRADARESALRAALAHARAAESRLRLQLDGEQRRHAIESGMLRDRLQRLERSLLSCVAAMRGKLSAPLVALPAGRLGAAAEQPHRLLAAAGLAAAGQPDRLLAAAASGGASSVPAPQAPAPFDPVATVASLLPLSRVHAGTPEADVDGALDRLQAVVRGVAPNSVTDAPSAIDRLAPDAALAHDGAQGAPPPADHTTEPALAEVVHSSETPWFPRAFRRLVEEDPVAAGRLFLQLLPAQGLVWPEDVAYRIEVAETGALAVDVRSGRGTVRALLEPGAARAGEPVLRTDLAALARAVVARRGWRVGARIAGARNRHLRPLRALAAAPLELNDLRRAGAHPDPALLLRLLALAIDSEWTAEEVFTVACRWRGQARGGCYVHVFERAPVAVTSAPPLGRVAATLSCEPGELLDVLVGELPLDGERAGVSGERAAVASLLEWFRRVDATALRQPLEVAGAGV
jgi:hypothetical protein